MGLGVEMPGAVSEGDPAHVAVAFAEAVERRVDGIRNGTGHWPELEEVLAELDRCDVELSDEGDEGEDDSPVEVEAAWTAEIQRLSRANTKTLHLPDGANQRDRDVAAVRTEDVHSKGWLYGYDAELAASGAVV